MKLNIYKKYQLIIVSVLMVFFCILNVKSAYAARVPTISGYVYNWQTRAPIPNIWIKWTYTGCSAVNCDCSGIRSWPQSSRYVKTNNQGFYSFADWQNFLSADYGWGVPVSLWGAQWNTRIDTNRDGIDDAFIQPVVSCLNGHQEPGNFGCYTNPHTFTAVKPDGWTGTFDTIQGVNFENDTANFSLPDIFYRESQPPIPTNTPGGPTDSPTPTLDPINQFKISGSIFIDINVNGIKDVGEPPYTSGHTVIVHNITDATNTYLASDHNGNYSLAELENGSYNVRIFAPTGYRLTSSPSINLTLGPSKTADFGITGIFSVSGVVFNDSNNNLQKDINESLLNSAITIDAPDGIIQTGFGKFQILYKTPGRHTISLTSPLPSGYIMLYPLNNPPPAFTFTVGLGCTVDQTTGANCSENGDISNLNFAITDSIPWIQSQGMNMRIDSGFTNYVGKNAVCSGPYTTVKSATADAGIIFSGNKAAEFGYGKASSNNWIVGSTAYPELYKPSNPNLSTSYASVLANIERSGVSIKNLASFCNLNNCTLPSNLPAGAYRANNDISLNSFSFPANKNYIFLVKGSLILKGNIKVADKSTALFTAAEDIIVEQSVGSVPSCIASANLAGLYSADKNVTIQGIDNCAVAADKMLVFEGGLFVNAEMAGGIFKNKRNLCNDNYNYPSILFKTRADFIFSIPGLLKKKNLTYAEEPN